jgi:hypothetical protein
MKKDMLKTQLMLMLLVVFMMPQAIKTWHILDFHHGHLDCHHYQKYKSGINPVDDHCPVCKLTFTFYGTLEHKSFAYISGSQTAILSEKILQIHIPSHLFNYQLRAPPAA